MARVGLVLVSHSAKLAQGARELAEQVAPGVPIAAVGGAVDGSLGTNAYAIVEAVESQAAAGGSILVLMDLGSAVLSAETALEQLDPSAQARVRLADAPFVEGAVAAAVEASAGSDLDAVLAVAEAARRQGKLG